MNVSRIRYIAIGFSIILLYYYRFTFLYPFAATWDQVDFVLALGEFDLLKMQPHFPGYPYFILGGLLFAKYFQFGPESLSLFNHVMLLSSCIPLYLLAKEWLPPIYSLLVVLTVQSSSYLTVMVSQPMSEGAALAVILWFLWSILLANKKKSLLFDILPILLFSILLGIRLSYISFGIGLIFHFYQVYKRNDQYRYIQIIIYALLTIMFQLIWIGALAMNVGGFSTLWNIAIGFSDGHFTEWGGTAEEGNLIERFIKLLFVNLIWVSLLSENVTLLFFFIFICGSVLFQRNKLKIRDSNFLYYIIVSSIVFYLFWALIAQNIDKPRHILPLTILVMYLLTIRLLLINKLLAIVVLIPWICINGVVGVQLLEKQKNDPPAVYKLEHYLRENNESFIIYTWEETRTFEYLKSPFSHKRVYTYENFIRDAKLNTNKTILLTGHVIQGFEAQGYDIQTQLIKRAEFNSDPLFDPIYARIELYEWVDR